MPALLMGEEVLEKLVSEVTVEIRNENGLHMRPAMRFVDVATRFRSEISIVVSSPEIFFLKGPGHKGYVG